MEKRQKAEAEKLALFAKVKAEGTKTDSGLTYQILTKGEGKNLLTEQKSIFITLDF